MIGLSRRAATVVVGVGVALVAVPAGTGYAAYRHDAALRGVFPAGSSVGTVSVGGRDQEQATAAVRKVVERGFDRPATIEVGAHSYTVTARQLGVTDDAVQAVARAMAQAQDGSWLDRAWDRAFGHREVPRVPVHVTPRSSAGLDKIVARAVADAARPPVNASVHLVGDAVRISPSRAGARLDPATVRTALSASLADGKPRTLVPAAVAPKVSEAAYDTVIVVHTGENRLYLYKHGQVARTFPVATGSTRYPTPTGRFHVELKRYLPTWVNPGSAWSKNEPKTIGPGPRNPLGTRALNISAPGIRIHGTPSDSSIGYSVSHGCIRMHMSDVEALYPLVPTGTTVFITKVGAPRLPGDAATVAAVAAATAANAADGG